MKDNQPRDSCRTYRLKHTALCGWLAALVAGGLFIWGAAWAFSGAREDDPGSWALMLLLSPVAVVMLGSFLVVVCKNLYRHTFRYVVTGQGLVFRHLFGERRMKWSDIADFELPASEFGKPPTELLLYATGAQAIRLPRNIKDVDKLFSTIRRHVPALDEHGFETPSVIPVEQARRSRQEHRNSKLGSLVFFPIVLLFFLLALAADLLLIRDHITWRRLMSSGTPATATVTAIRTRDGDVYAEVSFVIPDGKGISGERKVFSSFADENRVRGEVAILYDPANPEEFIIEGWDRAQREIIMLIFFIPLTWFLFLGAYGVGCGLLRPRQGTFEIGAVPLDESADRYGLVVPAGTLGLLFAAWPDRHRDRALVLIDTPYSGTDNQPSLTMMEKKLRRNGFEADNLADTVLLLDKETSQRLLTTATPDENVPFHYLMVQQDAASPREWVLKHLPDPAKQDLAGTPAAFFFDHARTGPFAAEELPAAAETLLKTRVSLFFDGLQAPELTTVERVKRATAEGEPVRIGLVQKRRQQELWIQHASHPYCTRHVARNGRLETYRNVPVPGFMKTRNLLGKLSLVFLGPFIVVVLFARVAVKPLMLLERRTRRKKLARAVAESEAPGPSSGDGD